MGGSAHAETAQKPRNKRWRVTAAETSFLEAVFERTRKPSRATIEHLAGSLAVRPRQVQVWFQNRRQRWRKEGSTAPSSPTGGDAGPGDDNVNPESLDSIMSQFLDVPAGRAAGGALAGAASSDEEDDYGGVGADDLSGSADGVQMGDTAAQHHCATASDAEVEMVLEDELGWKGVGEAAASSSPGAAYLDNLASLIDLGTCDPGVDASNAESASASHPSHDDSARLLGMDWLVDDSDEYAPEKGETGTSQPAAPSDPPAAGADDEAARPADLESNADAADGMQLHSLGARMETPPAASPTPLSPARPSQHLEKHLSAALDSPAPPSKSLSAISVDTLARIQADMAAPPPLNAGFASPPVSTQAVTSLEQVSILLAGDFSSHAAACGSEVVAAAADSSVAPDALVVDDAEKALEIANYLEGVCAVLAI